MNQTVKPHAIIFIGPPGSGKGTQAEKLKGYKHISTGDLLRAEIQKNSTIGMQCKALIEKGEMVPSSLISEILEANFAPKILLDGYPRTHDQAAWLEDKVHIDKVFFFDVDVESLVKRLGNRRVCPSCKAVYNLISKPPKEHQICDHCNTPIVQRIDDNEEIIRNRMRVYQEETSVVIDYYEKKGLLIRIDASLPLDEITRLIQSNIH